MKKTNLLEEPVKKLFLRYLMPSISATLVTSLYILADTLMIGRGVGAIGIAALNLLLPLYSLFFGTGMLFGVGGGVLLSISKGKGDEHGAREYFTAALCLAAAAGVVYVAAGQLLFDPVTKFLGRNETMDLYVREYGRILVWGAPVFLLSSFLQAFVRNDRAPKMAMIAVISGGVTNVILDYVFIFPMKMGMAGAAAATVIGSCLTLGILLTHLFSKGSSLRIVLGFKWRKAGEIVVNGLSSFLLETCSGIVMFLFNRQLLAYVGDLGVVVYGIISNSALIVASINNGISQASQPILAMNYGAGKMERLKETRRMGELAVCVAGALFVGVGMLFPVMVTEAFVKPADEILAMSVPAVRIYFLSFLPMGFNILFSTWFQSVLRPGKALFICLMRGLVLSSVLVFHLPMAFGVNGIWSVMPAAEFLTLGICLVLLKEKRPVLSENS
ncbi:MATE family efflux transporter [Lacrimispora sphenoides]|uniref:Multidrug export protein MepA n=1 Tax=Lacrimispora sphenoides JCM 1415 TaxID=1297793 RepID=A0ABY1C0Y0_9FIRM|nr:MATE family efflux transporter [Lacrimispora sphenoides]SET50186.1 putative efflux protein, MATE family [[Clostridium] sphenoides JCM 1415]SUY49483.1 multi antimicrobial extrusion protein MatE [Lacrimispora sphenoides]